MPVLIWRGILLLGGAWAVNRALDTADNAAGTVAEGASKGLEQALSLLAVGATVYALVKLNKE